MKVFAEKTPMAATLMLAGFLLACAGCARETPVKLVPATGVLKIKGKPAPNIMVKLLPDSMQTVNGKKVKGPTSSGISDEDGWFSLATDDGREGVIAGPCKVVLVDLAEERTPQGETAPSAPPRLSPDYGKVTPQSLTLEVMEDEDVLLIDIPG